MKPTLEFPFEYFKEWYSNANPGCSEDAIVVAYRLWICDANDDARARMYKTLDLK
ncbi:hypothetical protein L6Q82_04115 [Burkholderia cenocepacia]|uniref:hypothetical protein n=1 Tax=Burkholderia cenocepacia TaxID=95486 RepID=UPI001F41C4FD|nr:hypothetical protein [Burkholderia cenocepacia]MCG0577121.1 hypothetical protein [Burkholderia cenocepacia]